MEFGITENYVYYLTNFARRNKLSEPLLGTVECSMAKEAGSGFAMT